MRALARGQRRVRVPGKTVGDVIGALVARYPRLGPRLRSEGGALRPFVLVFLNSQDIRALQGEKTAVHAGDELAFVQALEGG